jgi:predicted enzyme related to lactoylglutathione lyase
MQVVKEYPDYLFCWVDLATTDPAGAKAFYNDLFGWELEDLPTDVGVPYTMCRIAGKNVAGLSAMPPDMQAQGVPTFWSSYVKHSDVDAIAAKITEAGGALTMPTMDVMESGRMLFATDPNGAAFGVWQPKEHIGAQLVNIPNTFVWNELQTRDLEIAKAFYTAVFDWQHDVDPSGYVTYKTNDRTHAGMMQIDESWGEVPNNWQIYFMVEGIDAYTEKVKELGGNVLNGPMAAGEIGRFSVVQDPQGGVFTIMEFSGPVDAPPGV